MPQAANQIFLVLDGEDASTTELLQKVAKALGKKSLLLPVPVSLMTLAAIRCLGKVMSLIVYLAHYRWIAQKHDRYLAGSR